MRINALCTDNPRLAVKHCDKVVYCGDKPESAARITYVCRLSKETRGDIYLPSMCDETELENACDYIVSTGARMIVHAAYELEESGLIEARYKLSPIMLLHKLGVLSNCTIAGGVCLDNDDLDLMAQEGVPLILLPTASAGYGCGFVPVCAAIKRGIRIGIGTFDNKYNRNADLDYEMEFLRLTTNADMSRENALTDIELSRIIRFE